MSATLISKNNNKATPRAKWVRRKNKTQNDLATHQSRFWVVDWFFF